MGYLDTEGLSHFWGAVKDRLPGPRGPAGPDGNPIGTVISFMGTTAPEDYLVCDGTEYSVSEYPKLAASFAEQFGEANHFGGDGTTTFAVPDLRNVFLRGYHGDAEERLSGEIGERQQPTKIPTFSTISPGTVNISTDETGTALLENGDNFFGGTTYRVRVQSPYAVKSSVGANAVNNVSMRPINAAVLYCIKAV